jgi:predicted dehydrogenase
MVRHASVLLRATVDHVARRPAVTTSLPRRRDAVRWGILGAAAIARNRVVPGMQKSEWCDVIALASRDGERARDAAGALGIPRAYGSYEALLDDPDIEAVYIPLPNHLHVPWSIRAAERGKHVLCEKPIALSADEARQLIDVRDRTGLQIGEAFMIRMHPQWLAVRDLLAADRIGAVRQISSHFSYYRRDPDDIRSRAEWGGGILMDVGCYAVLIARWLFAAEPLEVLAMVERDPDLGVDRLVSASMRFPDGQSTFVCGGQLVRHQRVQVFGTTGRIEVEIPLNAPPDRGCRIFLSDGSDLAAAGVDTITLPVVDQYAEQGSHFSRAVRALAPFPMSLEDSVANMCVIDALFRSTESGRWETCS